MGRILTTYRGGFFRINGGLHYHTAVANPAVQR
jgi:hypothetical protein